MPMLDKYRRSVNNMAQRLVSTTIMCDRAISKSSVLNVQKVKPQDYEIRQKGLLIALCNPFFIVQNIMRENGNY